MLPVLAVPGRALGDRVWVAFGSPLGFGSSLGRVLLATLRQLEKSAALAPPRAARVPAGLGRLGAWASLDAPRRSRRTRTRALRRWVEVTARRQRLREPRGSVRGTYCSLIACARGRVGRPTPASACPSVRHAPCAERAVRRCPMQFFAEMPRTPYPGRAIGLRYPPSLHLLASCRPLHPISRIRAHRRTLTLHGRKDSSDEHPDRH